MEATASTSSTIVYNPKANPYSKKHRRTWAGNILKNAMENASIRFEGAMEYWHTHNIICVGFDPTLPDVIYLLLCPPRHESLATLASYNMQTRVIELVLESMVPNQLRRIRSINPIDLNHVCPLVLQPWPTPLPTVASAPSP